MVVQTGIPRNISVYASQEKYELRDAISALKAARLWDFVEDLSLGINTVIGERGSPLSGGKGKVTVIVIGHNPEKVKLNANRLLLVEDGTVTELPLV